MQADLSKYCSFYGGGHANLATSRENDAAGIAHVRDFFYCQKTSIVDHAGEQAIAKLL